MEITMPIARILFHFIVLFLFVSHITKKYRNEEIDIKDKIKLFVLLLTTASLLEIFDSDIRDIKYVVCIIPLVYAYRNILKCSTGYTTVCILLFYIILTLSEMLSCLFIKIYGELSVSYFSIPTMHLYEYSILTAEAFYIILSLIGLFIKKDRERIKLVIENLTIKENCIITALTTITITPLILSFNFNRVEYEIYILIVYIMYLSLTAMIVFFFIKHVIYYNKAKVELNQANIYNKALLEIVDSLRLLKHDYNNILQAINGYILTKQYEELDTHIQELTKGARIISSVESVSPNIINQPAIYGVVGDKYFIATDKKMKFNINVTTDIKSIDFDFTNLSRIIGILLDNAIEAAEKSNDKKVSISFTYNKRKNADSIQIKNTVKDGLNIDINNIFNKGVSSKNVKSGLGLWEVRKIISKTKNAQIYAEYENNVFTQNIIIEKS